MTTLDSHWQPTWIHSADQGSLFGHDRVPEFWGAKPSYDCNTRLCIQP